MILLPETWIAHDFSAAGPEPGRRPRPGRRAARCRRHAARCHAGRAARGRHWFVWPVANPEGLFAAPPQRRTDRTAQTVEQADVAATSATCRPTRGASCGSKSPSSSPWPRSGKSSVALSSSGRARSSSSTNRAKSARPGGRQSGRGLRRGREGRRQVRPADHRHGAARRAVHSGNGQRREEVRLRFRRSWVSGGLGERFFRRGLRRGHRRSPVESFPPGGIFLVAIVGPTPVVGALGASGPIPGPGPKPGPRSASL